MKLHKVIVVLFCAMIIIMPVFTSLLRLDNIGLKFLTFYKLSSENAIFDWVKLYYFAIAITGLWLISLFTPGKKQIQFNRADIAIGIFLVMGLVMLIADSHRFDSSRRILELIGGFSMYFIAKNVFTSPSHKKAFLFSLTITIGILAVLGIVHYAVSFKPEAIRKFILPPITPESVPWEAGFGIRATSTIGNPNFLAAILIFVIPICISAIIFMKKDIPVILTAFVAISTFVLLLLTNSWGGYFGAIVSIVMMAVLYAVKKPRAKYKGMVLLVILACLIATIVFFSIKGDMALGKGKTGDEELVGVKSRYVLWESAWDMTKERPLTGWGLGNFFTYSNIFMSEFSTQEKYKPLWVARPGFLLRNAGRVHNEFLSLMVELGIPGLIVFLLIFGLYLYEVWKGWKVRRDTMSDIFIFGVSAGIFAVWVQSFLSFPFRLAIPLTIVLTGMGIAIQGRRWKTWEFTINQSGKLWIALAVPITAAAIYLMYQNTITAVCLYKFNSATGRYKFAPGKLPSYPDDKVLDDLRYCLKHWHTDHDAYFRLPLYLLFLNELDEAGEALEKLEYVQPYHEKTHYYRAEYWRKKGDYEKAVEAYKRAIKYEARFIRPHILLTETYLKMGKLEEARNIIDTALKYEPEAIERLEKNRRESDKILKAIDEEIKAVIKEFGSNSKNAEKMIKKIKEEAGRKKVDVHVEDILFYWLHNVRATLYSVNGNRDDAIEELNNTGKLYAENAGIRGTPIYSLHAEFPIFELNRLTITKLSNKDKPQDIREWTKRFYGASEWNEYRSLDLMCRNTIIDARMAKMGNPPYENLHRISRNKKANEKFQEALGILRQMAERFPPIFFTCDGIRSREIYTRIGIVYIQMPPPQLQTAIKSFEQSAVNTGDFNVANYNITLAKMIQEQDPRANKIRILNVDAEKEIMELSFRARRAEMKGEFEQAEKIYVGILNQFPLYAPTMVDIVKLYLNIGNHEKARLFLRQGLEIYPTHPQLNEFKKQLDME